MECVAYAAAVPAAAGSPLRSLSASCVEYLQVLRTARTLLSAASDELDPDAFFESETEAPTSAARDSGGGAGGNDGATGASAMAAVPAREHPPETARLERRVASVVSEL